MNELDHLRALRSEVAEPERASVDAAWRRVTERRRPRTARRRALVAAVAVAAVGAAFAIGLPRLTGGGDGVVPEAAAALEQAAERAANKPASVARPGQYVYTRSVGLVSIGIAYDPDVAFTQLERFRMEQWVRIDDGRGRNLRTCLGLTFASDADRTAWERAGRPSLGACPGRPRVEPLSGPLSYPWFPEGLSRAEFFALPRDPGVLYDRMRAAGDAWADGDSTKAPQEEMLTIVGDLLRATDAPPDLRAALFQAAARIPEVTLAGGVRDAAGRRGVAIEFSGPFVRRQLIFDLKTGTLLGERTLVLKNDGTFPTPPGTVIEDVAYVDSGVVDNVGQRP